MCLDKAQEGESSIYIRTEDEPVLKDDFFVCEVTHLHICHFADGTRYKAQHKAVQAQHFLVGWLRNFFKSHVRTQEVKKKKNHDT